jgi:hypothetical protein
MVPFSKYLPLALDPIPITSRSTAFWLPECLLDILLSPPRWPLSAVGPHSIFVTRDLSFPTKHGAISGGRKLKSRFMQPQNNNAKYQKPR